MAATLRLVVLGLLMHAGLCSVGQPEMGCKKWNAKTGNVCCEECSPGNRLVKECGPSASSLCEPCEAGTYTVNPKSPKCDRCTECVGALVQLKPCTATSDTVCGCKEGLLCGNDKCSFCVKKCGKGEEPAEKRDCKPCPEGTFNDQIHQKCKPWSTKCPGPDQQMVSKGNAYSDINCTNVSVFPSHKPNPNGTTEHGMTLVLSAIVSVALLSFTIIIIAKILRKKKKSKKIETKTPIIRVPTDDPRTLIAMECSFHEAQQEQGSSTESLDSKDSSDQLII